MLPFAAILTAGVAFAQSGGSLLDHPAIEYMARPLRNPVAELGRKIQAGKIQLQFDGEQGYLRSVLEALDVPIESQIAVFSKTSAQSLKIGPQSPRALFFNDSVVVGFVRTGSLELAVLDPQQGMIFYTVDQREWVHQKRLTDPEFGAAPLFARRVDCLTCHVSGVTHGIPGTLLRSVYPAADGMPLSQFPMISTDQRIPFEKLWGGWYVTGNSGATRHMGNAVVTNLAKPESMVSDQTVNQDSLKGKFDTSKYPAPYSDIVALMVFEHQTHMMNLLIEAGWKTRIGTADRRDVVNELVDYMLFIDEAPLSCSVRGTSGFAERFAAQGPRDGQGRSLRQFDLQRRLMRYPCSYMIYSEAFDNLPAEAKNAIYQRMWRILSGEENAAKYGRLSAEERKSIVQILVETKKDLPDYFHL